MKSVLKKEERLQWDVQKRKVLSEQLAVGELGLNDAHITTGVFFNNKRLNLTRQFA